MGYKPKLVHIITDLDVGGAQMMLYKLLAELDRDRFQLSVISLMGNGALGERIAALGIPIYTIKMRAGRPTPATLGRLVVTLRDLAPDVIQGWMPHSNLAAQVASLFLQRQLPVFWCVQNSVSSLKYEKPMTAAVIQACAGLSGLSAGVVYVSHVSRAQHERLGYRKSKGYVIPNGIDVAQYRPSAASRAAVRAELGLSDQAILIGLFARYHPQKDHATFLKAASLLAQRCPDAYFLLVGRDVDQNNQPLARLVSELGLAQRSFLLGERHDMARLSASLDIASSSSSFGEALSLALGEAMACEVPCVVTDVGDSGILVGDTGITVPPGDPHALANGWHRLVRAGPITRAALGQRARTRVQQHYSLAIVTQAYMNLYTQQGQNRRVRQH